MSTPIAYRRTFDIEIAEDSAFLNGIFRRNKVYRAGYYEQSASFVRRLAAGGPVAVPFGGVTTGQFVYIEVDGAIDLTIDAAAPDLKIRPLTGEKATLTLESVSITSLAVTNPGASEVQVSIFIAGV